MATETLPPEPEKKKTLFDIVLTSTPVILTVVATFLVGQSTSEMTRAQYYRSVAGQNQAKAGDQWALFQAKRARGQTQEVAATLLMAQNRSLFTRNTFLDVAQGMVEELKTAAQADPSKPYAEDVKKLIPKAEKIRDQAKAFFGTPTHADVAFDALLKPKTKKKSPVTKDSLEAKTTSESDVDIEGTGQQAVLLKAVIEDVKQKTPESEISKKALKLTDETLDKAIAEAERRAAEVNKRGKSIDSVLEEFDALKEQQAELAREYQQILARHVSVYSQRSSLLESTRALTAMLQGDYMAARLAYNARRYEDDARSNQESAYLYEVKVYLAAARSDKHLFRSKMFLFAMLAAQAGVTISTLALAVTRKSIFWALAAITGLIAIGFGTYVYLDMPMPTF